MANLNPAKFLREVRTESNKVTWPTRQETMVTAVMVCIMSILMAIFFFASDKLVDFVLGLILGLFAQF